MRLFEFSFSFIACVVLMYVPSFLYSYTRKTGNPTTRKAFMIGIGIITLMQFSGCFAMLNYSGNIFRESGSSLSPVVSTIIVGVIQLLGSYASTLLVERAGRRVSLN